MSIHVMNLVWKKSRNQRTAMLLLLAIADHAHDDGTGAFPSVRTLARKTRQSERNVQLLLKTLESSKELKIFEGKGPNGSNLYHVNTKLLESYADWESQEIEDVPDKDTKSSGANFSPPQTFHPETSREENAPNFTGEVKNDAESARKISPEPSFESSLNPNESSGQDALEMVKAHLKTTFYVDSEFDWSWLQELLKEIPDAGFLINHADRMSAMQSHSLFDNVSFSRSARITYARVHRADKNDSRAG